MGNHKTRLRKEIGQKLKALRATRRLSQVDLAKRLEISQAGLSLIERGQSSLNTEDFLQVLRVFNVPASHFYPDQGKGPSESVLQNALARLGAAHLYENESLPSENLEQAHHVIREVLIDGRNPRQITALAPVIVAQISQIHLSVLWAEFCNLGFERRLGWVLDNILSALRLAPRPASQVAARNYRQAETLLQALLGNVRFNHGLSQDFPLEDVLGASASSRKTLAQLRVQSSDISGKWQVASPLQVQDFVDALKASHDAS